MNKVADPNSLNSALFDAKNFYQIGNFMSCINTVSGEHENVSNELLAYSYYSYLAIDSGRIIATEIKENNTTALVALRYLYNYLQKSGDKDEIVQYFVEKLQEDSSDKNIWLMTAAIVFCHEDKYDNALKALNGVEDLDCMALVVQCLLKYNRADLAKQLVTKMQDKCDDATITQLALGWYNVTSGGELLQDAMHIFQEFCDKYSSTPLLLNGLAVCHIGQEKFEEADEVLKESLSKKPNDYDTLINLVVLSHLTGKSPEVAKRYMEQLKQFHLNSCFVNDMKKKEDEFDQLCLQYEPTNKATVTVS